MSNLFTNYGCDFDSVFKSGTGEQWLNIYGDNGMDIGQHYLAGTSTFNTGFYTHSGQDVRELLLTSMAASFADVRRMSGGWDAVGSTDEKRGYSTTYLNERRTYMLNNYKNDKLFTTLGDTDSWTSRIPKYENGSKIYRITGRSGMPAITSVRCAISAYNEYKAGIAVFHITQLETNCFGFVVGGYSRTNGWCNATIDIYCRTSVGEYLAHRASIGVS